MTMVKFLSLVFTTTLTLLIIFTVMTEMAFLTVFTSLIYVEPRKAKLQHTDETFYLCFLYVGYHLQIWFFYQRSSGFTIGSLTTITCFIEIQYEKSHKMKP